MMGKVIVHDREVDFDAAVNLMDNEIIEQINSAAAMIVAGPIMSEQAFIDTYAELHAKKYDGEIFRAD